MIHVQRVDYKVCDLYLNFENADPGRRNTSTALGWAVNTEPEQRIHSQGR